MKNIEVAHSPDADDIFMYYAIYFGWVKPKNATFSNIALDIETLNEEALKNSYDISAISFALYPFIKNEYALLRSAGSFGEGYGPKIIKKRDKKLKENFKVALSGRYTTNAMLFKIKYPKARVVYKNFLEIEKAILDGEVDAGVLIHESILEFDKSLEVEREMWDIWCELAKEEMPLPLGGMAIRRSLPLIDALEYEDVLIEAVRVANQRKDELSKILLEKNLVRVDKEKLDRYLSMYANDRSIEFDDVALKSIDRLFEIGYENALFSEILKCEDFLLPREYREYRGS